MIVLLILLGAVIYFFGLGPATIVFALLVICAVGEWLIDLLCGGIASIIVWRKWRRYDREHRRFNNLP